jgi:adenylate cyclase
MQDEITGQVAATIGGTLGVISRARLAEVRERPTNHLDAYERVLQTSAYYRDNYSPTEHAKVRESLESAVASDPGYALAWAFLSMIYLDEYRVNFNPRENPLDRALDAARRAVALDPASQFAHHALALVYFHRNDLDAFLPEAERAIALNPNNAPALASLGGNLLYAGDERGIGLIRKAMKLDPLHPTMFNTMIADYHFERGEYEESLAAVKKVDLPGIYYIPALLCAIYAELGRQREAEAALQELLKLWPGLTAEQWIEQQQKWNRTDDYIRRTVAAFRKAGLPE